MPLWTFWVVLGIILLVVEALTPEFIVASFAVGCFAAALVSLFTTSLTLQLVTFALATALVLWQIRPLFLRFLDSKEARTNTDLLQGQVGKVIEAVGPQEKRGRVKIGGEEWLAVALEGERVDSGERVEVVGVEGAKVIIKSIDREE